MTGHTRRDFFARAAAAAGAAGAAATLARGAAAATPAGPLDDAVRAGVAHFAERAAAQAEGVSALRRALRTRDLAAAKRAYIDARPPYEEIETLAAGFPEADEDIDARPYAVAGGEASDDFEGFHRIEALIFRDEDLDAALGWTDRLDDAVARLGAALEEPERFSPRGSFEGMIGLAEEIGAKKISSEEETWSDQTLLVFRANALGILSQYRPFGRLAAERDAAAHGRVLGAGEAFLALLEPHRTGEGAALTPYSRIGVAERRSMSEAAYALRSALIGAGEALRVI